MQYCIFGRKPPDPLFTIDPMTWTRIETRFGPMLATAQEGALTGLYFDGQKYFPPLQTLGERRADAGPFAALREQLHAFELATCANFQIPLRPSGTPFQLKVWATLQRIPVGERWTYAMVAQAIGASRAVRAVGAAIGRNPISVVIPCHRVVGANGALTGYAGGLERKQALLRFEAEMFERAHAAP
jgi:methylated-DNA-[protein]-cysteine S-methyltransferase